MMQTYLLLYFSLFFGSIFLLIVGLYRVKADKKSIDYKAISYPYVSILIAVRNEEQTILRCLQALEKLSWPKERLELLIGNDASSDNTAVIIQEFIKNKPSYQLIKIEHTIGLAKGKANVLAQLAHHAKGEFYFITDADIAVPSNWLQSLLANYNPTIGIVSGSTTVVSDSIFTYGQLLDWTYAFGMIKVVSDYSIPVTAVGNNMMISRKAYESTGGYESIPFSVTEDHQLFVETLKLGWEYKNLLNDDSLAVTLPAKKLKELLIQRKRWMSGAMKLPILLIVILFLQALFLPFLIIALMYYPRYGLFAWVIKIVFQQIFLRKALHSQNCSEPVLKTIFIFELYSSLMPLITILYSFFTRKIRWKGRFY